MRVVTTYSHKADGMLFVTDAKTDQEAIRVMVAKLNEGEEWCEAVVIEEEGEMATIIRAINSDSRKHWAWVQVGEVNEHGFCYEAVQW